MVLLDPDECERRSATDAHVAVQERQRRRDMREAGVEIGSPVPGTMEPTIPYASGPTASDYAARFLGRVDSSTLPIEEVD